MTPFNQTLWGAQLPPPPPPPPFAIWLHAVAVHRLLEIITRVLESWNSFKTSFRKFSVPIVFFPRKQHNAKVRFQCCRAVLEMCPIRP